MFAVYFDSEVKGLLRINGNSSCDICGKAKKICLNSSFIVEFYPYDSVHESFCEKINLKCLQPKNCRILWWTNDVLTVQLCPKKLRDVRPLVALSQVVFAENTFTLCDDGSSFLLMENEQSMHIAPIDFQISNGKLSIEQIDGADILRLDASNQNNCYLGLYETVMPFRPVYEGIGDSFSFDGQIISRIKTFSCMSHAKVKNEYSLARLSGELITTDVIEYDREYIMNSCKTLKIFAFLEGLRDEIQDVCECLLHDDLKRDFTIEMGKQFFGEFTDIVQSPVNSNENVVSLMCKNGRSVTKMKHYLFEFENGLINNFSVLP